MTHEAPAQTVEMLGEQYDDFLSLLPLDLVPENVVFKEIRDNNPETRKASTEKPYPCRICIESFRKFSSLQCHLRKHTAYQQETCEKESENAFACIACDLVFENEQTLRNHRKVHREGGRYCCKECGKTFSKLKRFEFHLGVNKAKIPFIGTNSTPGAVNDSETSFHTQFKENKISFICTECGECFISYKGVRKHQKIHTAFKLLKDLDSDESGTEHLINTETQITNPSLACPWCGDVFWQKEVLQAHQETHIGDSNVSQTEHPMTHQSVPKGERHHETLQECGGSCIQTEPLASDQSLHAFLKQQEESCTSTKSEPSFSCNQCNKIFSNKVNLLTHQKIHTCDKPFACEVCDKRFTREECLLYHQRIHPSEKIQRKPPICSECGKSFLKKSHLRHHQQNHLRLRLYVCAEQGKEKSSYNSTDCDQSYTVRMELQTHQQKHNDTETFTRQGYGSHQKACTDTVCDQSSTDLAKYQEMLKEGHYTCRGCERKFTYQKSFLKHMKAYQRNGLYLCAEPKTEAESFTHNESDQSLTDKMDIGQPHEKHEEEQQCVCRGCEETFTYREDFLKHQKAYFREGLYLCSKNRVEKEPLTDSDLGQNITNLETQEKLDGQNCTCRGCGRKFTYQKSYLKHQKFYLRGGFYLCTKSIMENEPLIDSECDKRFTDLENPQEKQENHFTCRGCGKKFINQRKFQKHQKSYLSKNVYLCSKNKVEKEPLTDSDLGQNITNLETQEKLDGQNCTCMGCGRKFTYQKSYLKHQKCYFREGLYLCTQSRMENEPLIDSECDKRFTDLENPQEKQDQQHFTCRWCGKKFIHQRNFRKHQKTYLSKNVYLCSQNMVEKEPLTDGDLGQSVTNLEKQEKQDGQNCTCRGCGRKFTYQKSYLKHQKCFFREGLYLCTKGNLKFA